MITIQNLKIRWNDGIQWIDSAEILLNGEKIGSISLNFMDLNKLRKLGWDPREVADGESSDLFEAMISVSLENDDFENMYSEYVKDEFYEDGRVMVAGKLVYLKRLYIKKKYRNQGYGKMVMKYLINWFKKRHFSYFLLFPYPVEENEYFERYDNETLELSARLAVYYEKLGFEFTRGPGEDSYEYPHMILDLSKERE